MALTDDDVREILRIIDESELESSRSRPRDSRCTCCGGGAARSQSSVLSPRAAVPRTSDPAPPTPDTPHPTQSSNGTTIDAPMLGTFYRAEAPGAKPFVEVGATVEADTTVCIIEVMKMMNSISAGVERDDRRDLRRRTRELVEYGQPLFRVEPA